MQKNIDENKNTVWEHSPFMELFASAVFFLQKSRTEYKNINLHSRESIINCVFALEASANCALDRLELPRKFQDDIDKLTTINKFELFLLHEFPGIQIDRGNSVIQKIEELINIRNKFVHPRYVRLDGEYLTESLYVAKKVERKNVTKIPSLTSHWTSKDAENAVQAIVNFFVYFFVDLCKYSNEHVSGILCTKNHHPNGSVTWIISRELMIAFKTLEELGMLKREFMKVPDGDYDINFTIDEDADK